MRLRLYSFDGDTTINDGANFESFFAHDSIFRLVKPRTIDAKRIGDFPVWTSTELQGGELTIQVKPMPGVDLHLRRDALAQIFDVYDTSGPKALVVRDTADGDREWYVDCVPIDFKEAREAGKPTPAFYEITLFAPDPVWREVDLQTDTWNPVATGATRNITVRGNRPTPLELRITPTANKTNDFGFEHLVVVRNPNPWELDQYPIDITNGGWNTAAIIAAVQMQDDGDDLRVYVDGKRVARWLADINTDHTKVWINLDMRPRAQVTLDGAFDIGDLQLEYRVGSKQGRFPHKDGYIRIDDEVIVYERWNRIGRYFESCTRGAFGTTAADHLDGATAYWIEHHIKIVYGDATLSAPRQDDNYRPIFNMSTSTNASWVYAEFGEEPPLLAGTLGLRSGSWMHRTAGELRRLQTVDAFTGPGLTFATPWTEMGLGIQKRNPVKPGDYWDEWYFRAQIDLTNTSFTGRYIMDNAADVVRFALQDKVPEKKWRNMWAVNFTTNLAWTAWGPTVQAPRAGARELKLLVINVIEGDNTGQCGVEVQDCTLTFSASQRPVVSGPTTWGRIADPYHNLIRLTNNTTGEYIKIDFIQFLGTLLDITSEDHTIIYRGQNQYQALEDASSWEQWLMAVPGVNQLRINEAGLVGVQVVTRWRGRNS